MTGSVPEQEPDPERVNEQADQGSETVPLTRRDLQDRAIHGALWTLTNTFLGVGVGFLVNILLARVLGVIDYGRLAYLTTVIGIAGSVAGVGIGTGMIQFGSKAHAAGRTQEVQALLSKSQGFRLLVTAPIMTAAVLLFVHVDWPLLLLAIFFGVWVSAALSGAPDCLTIENKTAAGAKNAMVINLMTQAGVVVVVFAIGTADSVWAVRTIIGSLGVATALVLISPQYRRAVLRPSWPRNFPPGFWRFALPAGVAAIIGSLVVSRTEVVVLTWMAKPEAAGVFALAFGLAMHLFSPAEALIGPLVPAISGLHEVDTNAVGDAFGRTVRAASTVAGLVLAAAMPAFALLIPLIYGTQFAQVPPVLLALAFGGSMSILLGPIYAFVQARLQGQRLLWVNLAALGVNLAFMLALIPLLGVWGAVIGNVAGTAVRLLWLMAGEVRALELPVTTVLRDVTPMLLGAATGWLVWWAASSVALPVLVSAAAAGLSGLGSFIVGTILTRSGLGAKDVSAIVGVLPKAARGPARATLRTVSHRNS